MNAFGAITSCPQLLRGIRLAPPGCRPRAGPCTQSVDTTSHQRLAPARLALPAAISSTFCTAHDASVWRTKHRRISPMPRLDGDGRRLSELRQDYSLCE